MDSDQGMGKTNERWTNQGSGHRWTVTKIGVRPMRGGLTRVLDTVDGNHGRCKTNEMWTSQGAGHRWTVTKIGVRPMRGGLTRVLDTGGQ